MRRRKPGSAPSAPWRPTRAQLESAHRLGVPDVIDHGIRVLFVGINPGLYSAAIGHHFGRPGNRFWPALFAGGFTPRLFSPFEEILLLELGIGLTNLVERATATAHELATDELRAGVRRLERKLRRYRPEFVAPLGLTSYRTAFAQTRAKLGEQSDRLAGARIWLLPNPSGLNAHHQPADLARLFRELRISIPTNATRPRQSDVATDDRASALGTRAKRRKTEARER